MIGKHALVVITSVPLLQVTPTGLAQSSAPTQPHPLVSPIFGDNMVLQRGKMNTIWGWSEPGGKVTTIEIGGKSASGTVGADHRWQVKIKPPPAGGPYSLRIQGPQIVELHNVLVGDVWLCGGQSNMQVGLGSARSGEEEVKAANFSKIQFFSVALTLHITTPIFRKEAGKSYRLRRQTTCQQSRITLLASPTGDPCPDRPGCGRSWRYPRRSLGRARRRFVRSRTSMFRSRNWKNCPPPARLNMETM